jgi:hypothetical protein
VKAYRLALLLATIGCLSVGALVPAAGCNGTGTTPICDFPDGANNPESGCGVIVEASVSSDGPAPMDAPVADSIAPVDSPAGKPDASDATLPPDAADAHVPDAGDTGADSGDAHIGDAKSDAKG